MSITLLGDREAATALRRLGRERMNIAIAAGLNRTMVQIDRDLKTGMTRTLDRPTPFTLNALRTFKADRNRLSAKLYIQPIQARYLQYAVKGGRLETIIEPIQITLDRHGNIRGKRGGLKKIASMGRNRFVATINGATGVWQRYGPKGRKLKLLVKSSQNRQRRPRFDFFGIAERTAQRRLATDIREAIAREIRLL